MGSQEQTLDLQPNTRKGRENWPLSMENDGVGRDTKDYYGIQLEKTRSSFGKWVIRAVINNINAAVDGQHKINSILCLWTFLSTLLWAVFVLTVCLEPLSNLKHLTERPGWCQKRSRMSPEPKGHGLGRGFWGDLYTVHDVCHQCVHFFFLPFAHTVFLLSSSFLSFLSPL